MKMNVQSIKIAGRRINHRSRSRRKRCMYKVNGQFNDRTIIIIQVLEWDIRNKMVINRITGRRSIFKSVETMRGDGVKTVKIKNIKPRSRVTRSKRPCIRNTGRRF